MAFWLTFATTTGIAAAARGGGAACCLEQPERVTIERITPSEAHFAPERNFELDVSSTVRWRSMLTYFDEIMSLEAQHLCPVVLGLRRACFRPRFTACEAG